MYRIGEFSMLSKTTIKTLRYYEKEKLLLPSFVDPVTGYRFYDTKQLVDLAKILSLRQVGMSIDDIKHLLNDNDITTLLQKRKLELESNINLSQNQLQKINYLLEGKNMNYELIQKELPECVVYYKEGVIKNYSDFTNFILSSAEECKSTNPNIKCLEPHYCFVNYLDGEFKEKDIKIRYSQAVLEKGIPNKTIKFQTLPKTEAVCIYHKGSYDKLGQAYSFIMKWIEDNHYKITDYPRERYIDGIWNKENVEDWITEIQVPVVKK